MRIATFILVGMAVIASLSLSRPASAQFPGSALLIKNGGSSAQDLFDISGSTIRLTGDLTGASKWFISADGGHSYSQLVGISALYLVNINGTAPTNVTIPSTPGSGFVRPTATSGTKTDWVRFSSNGYKGYDDNGPGSGFSDGSHWLVLADPSLANKSSINRDKYGQFDMGTNLLNNQSQLLYNVGFDYITDDCGTGRGYITNAKPRTSAALPEPSSLLLALLPIAGLALRARRRSVTR